jgi:predicted RNA-binding protein with PUA-like domain
VPWVGVRNYQARNFMRDEMHPGDGVLFYHSSCPEPGVAGIAEVVGNAYPDATQFDPDSPYFDPKSSPEAPRWVHVDVRLIEKTRLLPLSEMREAPSLATMQVLKRGNRLSITPVTADEWRAVKRLLAAI